MFFAKKGKIGHYTSPDFNILKIENGQLVVLTFCFQFPPPKVQAIKNSNLTKQFMCSKFCKKRCYCW